MILQLSFTLPSVLTTLRNLLEQEIDIDNNGEITKDEVRTALIMKSVYSKGIESLPVWCNTIVNGICKANSVATAEVYEQAKYNFLYSAEHKFDGSGFVEVSNLESTYPSPSWDDAECKLYDHGATVNARNVTTSWQLAKPSGAYTKTCGYINGMKSSGFTTDAVLTGKVTEFIDKIPISTNNLFKRVYCVAALFAWGCTDAPACTTATKVEVKSECSVGLYYVSCFYFVEMNMHVNTFVST